MILMQIAFFRNRHHLEDMAFQVINQVDISQEATSPLVINQRDTSHQCINQRPRRNT